MYDPRNPREASQDKRRESFRDWVYKTQDIDKLVQCGFFYTGEEDIVRCFHCDVGLADWGPEDDPWVEHARHSHECPFLKGEKGEQFINSIQSQLAEVYTPKHPHMNECVARLETFRNFPQRCDVQRPEHLASAGFFYTGECIRCHYCDGVYRSDVERGNGLDKIWINHARYFPFCKFLQILKGLDFIKDCKAQNYALERPGHYLPVTTGPKGHMMGLSTVEEYRIREERYPMWSAAAQSLLDIGYREEFITEAIKMFRFSNPEGTQFDAECLLEIIESNMDLLSE